MSREQCKDCPFLVIARELCREVEGALPFMYAPPLHRCTNHPIMEAGRDQIAGQVHRLKQVLTGEALPSEPPEESDEGEDGIHEDPFA